MKRLLPLLFALAGLFLLASPAQANERAWGKCWSNTAPGTQQLSVSCTVTVYLAGTTTLATLYSDNAATPTPQSNPFGASSATGVWAFYAANGRYDVRINAGTPGLNPYTIPDIFLTDSTTPGGLFIGTYTVQTYSATPVFNASASTTYQMTLTGNVVSSTVTNPTKGQQLNFDICQDSSGSRTFAWPANFIGAPAVGSTASTCTGAIFVYDGVSSWRNLGGGGGGGGPTPIAIPTVTPVTFSNTPAFSITGNDIFTMTLTGNVTSSTITGTAPTVGMLESWQITQDATGSRSFVWPTSFSNPPAINTAPGVTTYCSEYYNGSNFITQACSNTSSTIDGEIRYVAPWGLDTNDGMTQRTAFATIYHAICSMFGGNCSTQTGGTGTVYVYTHASANPTSGAGVWLMGATDPNYSSPPTGWLRDTGPLAIIGQNFDVVTPNARLGATGIHGGGAADTSHPLFWFSGIENGPLIKNIEALDNPGQYIKAGVYSDGTQGSGSGLSGFTWSNIQWAVPNGGGTLGPGIFIGSGTFDGSIDNLAGSGDPGASAASDSGSCFVMNPSSNGSGVNSLNHSMCNGGGIRLHGASTLNVDDFYTENQSAPGVPIEVVTCPSGCFDRFNNISVADGGGNVPAVKNDALNPNLVHVSQLSGNACNMSGPMVYQDNYPQPESCNDPSDPTLDGEYGTTQAPASIGSNGTITQAGIVQGKFGVTTGGPLDLISSLTSKDNLVQPLSTAIRGTLFPDASGGVCLTTSCNTQSISDSFDRANGSVGANYSAQTGATIPQIISNQVQGNGATVYGGLYTNLAWPVGTQSAQVTAGIGQTSCGGVSGYQEDAVVMASNSALSGYFAICNGSIILDKVTGGSDAIQWTITGDMVAGDRLLITAVPSGGNEVLSVYKFTNGTQSWSLLHAPVTDSSSPFTTGFPAMRLEGTTNSVSNFSAWAAGGPLQVTGLFPAIKTVSADYTFTISDFNVLVTGTHTITAPHALNPGQVWNLFSSTGTVTLQADSGNMNGGASVTVGPETGAIVWCDGTNCFAIQGGGGSGGGVSNFSAGNFTGLFSTSVATSTTTPALSFNPTSFCAYCFWGNNTASGANASQAQVPFAGLTGTATEAQLPAATMFTDQNFAFGAHNADFSLALFLKVPNSAGCTTSGIARICFDSTNNNYHVFNSADRILPPIEGAITTGDLTKYVSTGGRISLQDSNLAASAVFANVMTTLGDTNYGGASGVPTRLAGPTAPNSVPETYTSTPSGSAATAPAWSLPGLGTRSITGSTSTDTLASADCSPKRVAYVGSASVAVTLPTATTLAVAGCTFRITNHTTGAGTVVTVTPTTWTVSVNGGAGVASMTVAQTAECTFSVDDQTATQWDADCTGPVAYVKATGQTMAISAATIFATGTNDTLYHGSADLDCTTTSAAAVVTVSLKFTDTSNTVQTIASGNAACTALGSASIASFDLTFQAKGGTNIQYLTTITNTPTYNVRVAVTQLGAN